MSRFLLVLCLIIGSYTANAATINTTTDSVEANKAEVLKKIENGFDVVKNEVQHAKNVAKEHIDKINVNFKSSNVDYINKKINDNNDTLNELILNAEKIGADADRCKELASRTRPYFKAALSSGYSLVTDNFKEAQGEYEKIQKLEQEINYNLTAVKDEALRCFSNINGTGSTGEADSCINKVSLNAANIVNNEIPKIVSTVNEIKKRVIYVANNTGVYNLFTIETQRSFDRTRDLVARCNAAPKTFSLH